MTTVLMMLALAQPPAGTIVIRPGGSAPVATPAVDPPGKIVIRPQAPGTPRLETPTVPKPQPVNQNPIPVADPKPVQDPKPAAAEPEAGQGKLLTEIWDLAFVKGMKIGYFTVQVREFEKEGKKYLYATKRQEVTMGRFGQPVKTLAEDATLETLEGEVRIVRMSQEVSSGQRLAITGVVEGQMLKVKGEGMAAKADSVPWPEGVIGFHRELGIYKEKKSKPGDSFDYNVYEGRVNQVVNITVKCLSLENVALIEGQPAKPHLKFEAKMQKIGVFQIPAAYVWVDAETYEPMRTDQDLPSLGGRLTLLRSTKEICQRPVGKVPDLFDVQSIKLPSEIPGIHEKAAVTYKINLSIDPEPFTCFTKDDRQVPTLTGPDRKLVELRTLHPAKVVPAIMTAPVVEPPKEVFLGSSFFIDWENDVTKKQALLAVAGLPATATNEDRAKAVESWVHKNMKAVEFSQAMAPTSEVSKNLTGDCTEYAMLCTGLCRALGIPSRTALGLVYAPGTVGKPVLAYHMWFEVWINSRWVPFDATLGRGGIGAGHIKITDAHWHKETSFAPLLPVLRVLIAQPKVESVAVEEMR